MPESVPTTVARVSRSARSSAALLVLTGLAVVATLYVGRTFFVPLLIGVLMSYALRPLVDGLGRLHVPRYAGAGLVLLALVGGLAWVTLSVRDDVVAMVEKLPQTASRLRQAVSTDSTRKPGTLQKVQQAARELERAAAEVAGARQTTHAVAEQGALTTKLRDYVFAQSPVLVAFAAQALLVLLLAYFLLASGDFFRRNLVRVVGPSLSHKKITVRILEDIDAQVQRYLLTILACNLLVGLCTWLAFAAMGVDQAEVWGVAAGALHFIPYLGPAAIAVTSGIAGFMQFGTILDGLAVGGASLAIAAAIGFAVMTWLQAKVAHVNAAVLFIGLLFFGWLWGVWGLLLGAPLVAIAKVICEHIEALQPIGELLGGPAA